MVAYTKSLCGLLLAGCAQSAAALSLGPGPLLRRRSNARRQPTPFASVAVVDQEAPCQAFEPCQALEPAGEAGELARIAVIDELGPVLEEVPVAVPVEKQVPFEVIHEASEEPLELAVEEGSATSVCIEVASPVVEDVPLLVENEVASIGDSEVAEKPSIDVPSMKELLTFCLPTLGIWLCSPLLSLIDTSVVGLSAPGVAQLAALAPSTKLCDYVAFFCTVLGAATTNLAADALAIGQPARAKQIVGSSLSVGLVLGLALALAMAAIAGPAMSAMLGAASSPLVLEAASSYTSVRALGYPAALVTMVLQAGFVAAKDSRTPLLAVPFAATVNLLGDLLLVGPLQMGATGAAWATVGSLYANAAVLMVLWRSKMRALGDAADEAGLFRKPSGADLKALVKFAVPMMVALCARVYMGLSITLSAVTLGTTALAANQVIDSLYWLFCPLGEAFSLCMQAYLPPLLLQGRSLARRMQKAVLRAAAAVGLLGGLTAAGLPLLGAGLFTASAPVATTMAASAPALGLSLAAYTVACATEGMLIARKRLRFLAAAHVLNTAALSVVLNRAVRCAGCGLHHVWAVFCVCNLLRLVEFSHFMKKADEEAVVDSRQWLRNWARPLRSRIRLLRHQPSRHLGRFQP